MNTRNHDLLLPMLCLAVFIAPVTCHAVDGKATVVVYTALDQLYSEPILREFEKEAGIKVKAVYDIEATKTVGLVNRLIAEQNRPVCDVFWNNEIVRTILLKRKGLLARYVSPSAKGIPAQFKDKEGTWAGFAARARVLVVNTDKVAGERTPASIFDLTKPEWKGASAMGNPLFGTTATHVAALFAYLGRQPAEEYFRNLAANGILVLAGNAMVKDQVGAGELPTGLTDSDDVNMGILSRLPIKAVYPDQKGMGTLLIPNTVCMIEGCPHPEAAKRLIDFLLSARVEEKLAFCPSAQMPLRKEARTPPDFVTVDEISIMTVDYDKVADAMEESARFVQQLFIR